MVEKVYGTVDGVEVIMQKAGDRWQVPVPFDVDGQYVVEVVAEDEAGNRSYLAKMLFAINTALLRADMIPLPYCAVLQPPGHRMQLAADSYGVRLTGPTFRLRLLEGGNKYADGAVLLR